MSRSPKKGLKDVYKGFNLHGEELVTRLQAFKQHGVHVLGSFIFGLPSDRAATFDLTAALAERADVTFAQFVMLTPYPGTLDFMKWEKETASNGVLVDGVPITRHWLIPKHKRPKVYTPHPTLSAEELRVRTQGVWDKFLQLAAGLEAVARHSELQGAAGVHHHVEALSTDVCQDRHCHRQRAGAALLPMGADAGRALPPHVRDEADAGARLYLAAWGARPGVWREKRAFSKVC